MIPSGGILWHWRAWRSQQLWRRTAKQIEDWLLKQPTKAKEIVIIGASAGWMLPSSWLQKFQLITTYDIDPIAGHLFKLRHGSMIQKSHSSLVCHNADGLSNLNQLLSMHKNACFWFDNVLGQLRFHIKDNSELDAVSQRINSLKLSMNGREWGSIHDLYSGRVIKQPELHIPNSESALLDDASGTPKPFKNLISLNPQGPWLDHLCQEVFKNEQLVHYFAWPYQKDYWHVLQAGWGS